MAQLNEIKHHIHAVRQTWQITRAMQLISTVKMRKALHRLQQNDTYIDRTRTMMKDILLHTQDIRHPFLQHSADGRTAYLVIAGDKGLAGAFNNNVLNLALNDMKAKQEKYIFTVGQMATRFFKAKDQMVDVEFLHTAQNPELYHASQIADVFIDLFQDNMVDQIDIVYTHLLSTTQHQARIVKLLPLELSNFTDIKIESTFTGGFQYEPNSRNVFNLLARQYIVGIVYASLVQSYASEQCARMQAMDNATQNAEEMIGKLSQQFRQARQTVVTQEIMEIIGSANLVGDNKD